MKITKEALLRLGFEEFEDRCFKRLNTSIKVPDLLLDWDPITGLWLTDPLDPMEKIYFNLNHIETIAQLTRLHWLLTGKHLLYNLGPVKVTQAEVLIPYTPQKL